MRFQSSSLILDELLRLQNAGFLEAEPISGSDDDVIDEVDLQDFCGFRHAPGSPVIGFTWGRFPTGMIMDQHETECS